ncbi:hypothetical protein AVEN_208494-1 [Araneus ventricosus]|uniref:Uncharacterized protein n=1 Tax=Araneus ventricosus TaxID=182803 RepID=A0A4Y2UUF6_ARAVE|nr:hypothetical protein AVEN_208494-1 [Araneus ventricosus]
MDSLFFVVCFFCLLQITIGLLVFLFLSVLGFIGISVYSWEKTLASSTMNNFPFTATQRCGEPDRARGPCLQRTPLLNTSPCLSPAHVVMVSPKALGHSYSRIQGL